MGRPENAGGADEGRYVAKPDQELEAPEETMATQVQHASIIARSRF